MKKIGSFDLGSFELLTWAKCAQDIDVWFIIAVLAWVPFPLGSNREWSWALLVLLFCGCWLAWIVWILANPRLLSRALKRLWLPATLSAVALLWAVVQALPIVPMSWVHPVWRMTAELLQRPVSGSISLNPWRSLSEVVKLFTYLLMAFLVFTLTHSVSRSKRLLDAIIAVGAFYASYAFVLGVIGQTQFTLFYSMPAQNDLLAGPFVLHNSFATFEGLASLASLARLVELSHDRILASRGIRLWALTSIKFTFGSGLPIVVATILTVSALIASASRGGVFSTIVALLAMAIFLATRLGRRMNRRWVIIGALALFVLLGALVWISGATLTGRAIGLIDGDNTDAIRLTLWDAALRMITSSPLLGLGLGTFQDAYPIYADKFLPFIIDKVHCDYLEFAAGLGLPAALCWWGAIVACMAQMVLGLFKRRKDWIYPLIGIGGTILVAVHSAMDFSLQIPAVALTYAILLGIGMAQSYSTSTLANEG